MRLHHLSITAFGPFAETASVDFDELSAAGVFLLTGATGAGKTSVLDAVCFALYGQVPGDRAGAKHLRSDHAAPDQAPEVVLRFSVGERQFTITRSPSWMRPKLRGAGETKVQAHVVVEELRDHQWTVLTNRLDDAGLLVTDLLGMTCPQFTQVAMLPQGRFQAFLRATSADRHDVLQHLFRTDRFERIEQWLVERRSVARREADAVAEKALETLNRLCEASGADTEPDWLADLDGAVRSGLLAVWVEAVSSEATAAEADSAVVSQATDRALAIAGQQHNLAVQQQSLRARGTAARRDLTASELRCNELSDYRARLADHERAMPLSGLAKSRSDADRLARAAERRWAEARRSASTLLAPESTREVFLRTLRQVEDAHAVAVGFGQRDRARQQARGDFEAIRVLLQATETGIAELEITLAAQPALISDSVAAVHEARAAAARYPLAQVAVERLEGLSAMAKRAELVGLEAVSARTDVLAATSTAQTAREQYLDLREARINGMAGELAGQLASGCSCPVCGSSNHPAPARASAAAIGRPEEDRARKALDDSEFELQTRQVVVATLEGELNSLEQRLVGVDRSTLAAELETARDEIERQEPLVAALDVLVAREDKCRAELRTAEVAHRAALVTRADLRARGDQISATIAAVEEEWSTLLAVPGAVPGEDPGHDLARVTALRAAAAETLRAAVAELDAWGVASKRAGQAAAELIAAAEAAGFVVLNSALAAILEQDEVQRLRSEVELADLSAYAANLTLADPAVAEALAAEAPSLADTAHALSTAEYDARAAVAHLSAATSRRERVAVLSAQLDERLRRWEPLAERHRTVALLAAFVEGKGVDNPLRMRLAAYVLTERLRQVVAAANERLAGMTDHRYALEHSDDRGFGEQRGGLSLRVRDDWNGVHRDPATLSGGETFVVSLALALGLADTVAGEAGGTDIDTLFIDEGFGSLDSETLEDVMDTLDSLRDGGRVVGLVSHVLELRSRITTQLDVSKGRNGSTLRTMLSEG
jgi:exonuclease SbcC